MDSMKGWILLLMCNGAKQGMAADFTTITFHVKKIQQETEHPEEISRFLFSGNVVKI